jgi:sulfonate transport system permease protein
MSVAPVEVQAARPRTPLLTSLRNASWSRLLWTLLGLVIFIGAWELAAAYMAAHNPRGKQIFPSWSIILTDSVRDFDDFVPFGQLQTGYMAGVRVLLHHSLITAERVFVGTALGIAVGVTVGSLMSYSRLLRELVGPVVNVLRTVPLLALIPLFILWFSGRTIGVILFIAFAVMVMMVVATFHAAQNAPRAPARFARTMGASRARMYRDVVVPAMVPELFAAVRIVFALSWSFALGGEFTGAQSGLGFLMIQSEKFGFLGRVMVVVLLFTVYAVFVDALLLRARRLVRWAPP